MGAGEASISKKGKFRVFVLMGQSNMQGAGRERELKIAFFRKARPDPDLGEGQGRCEVDSL